MAYVWRGGKHKDGTWTVETTVCPHRLTTPWSEAVVAWFLRSARFNGFASLPDPAPEWPFPGGLGEQPAKLVAAFDYLRVEMQRVHSSRERSEPDEKKGRREIGSS